MNDPLNINIELTGVETDVPLLPEGDYNVQCTESSVDVNKAATGHNWSLKLVLTEPTLAGDREIKPGFPLYSTIALQAREDSKDPEAFKRGISEAIDALFSTDKNTRPALSHALVTETIGKTCVAHVYTEEYQGRKGNRIKRLKPNAS